MGGVALGGVALGRATLGGVALRGATLGGVALRGATLGGVALGRATLGGVALRGATLGGVALRGATLRGATLGGVALGRATLGGVALRGATLGGVALRGATLGGVALRGATLGGATGDLASDVVARGGAALGVVDTQADLKAFAVGLDLGAEARDLDADGRSGARRGQGRAGGDHRAGGYPRNADPRLFGHLLATPSSSISLLEQRSGPQASGVSFWPPFHTRPRNAHAIRHPCEFPKTRQGRCACDACIDRTCPACADATVT
ncbi:pentapeptide repeat-containing protein [Streptomyces purpureus]|uniref:pentapeptide repeat-containing protein n=1 Tax=Streptomyces purpureus TaxID=1951 RepID=UPI0035EE173E